MKRCVVLLFSVFLNTILSAQNATSWLRYPAISPDGRTIAFSCYGNLYTVPATGGNARLLVNNAGQNLKPVWNHSGTAIAFASNGSGNFDLYIVSVKGGEPQRLSWHAADEYPTDFSEDDKFILFSAARMDNPACRQFPSEALPELYKIPVNGGRITQVLTTPAEDARISNNGDLIVYHDRKARENPWRKHQVSSAARDIWVYNQRSQQHIQLTAFAGEDRTPVFAKDPALFYFLSERSGSFNVFQSSLSDTSMPRQITFFRDHPVRFLSVALNNRLCFGYDGGIWIKDTKSSPRKLNINLPQQDPPRAIMVNKPEITEFAVAPSGKEIAFITRGEVFVCDAAGGKARRISHTAAREAGLSFSPDSKTLVYASERNNKWTIIKASVEGDSRFFYDADKVKEEEIISGKDEVYQPKWSPDGQEIAYIANRNTLRIFNCSSGLSRTILTGEQLVSRRDFDQYFEWSPDSRWLLVQFTEQYGGNEEAGLVSASGNTGLVNLTRSGFNETKPGWAMSGKSIFYATDKFGLHSFDNSGPSQSDIVGITFNESVQTDAKPQYTTDRKTRLTNSSALLGEIIPARDETLYYLASSGRKYDLWQTDFRTNESKIILPLQIRNGNMQWSQASNLIYILCDGNLLCVDPVKAIQSKLNIETNLTIDPAAERAYMFEHLFRRTAQTFYTSGYHGTNWEKMGSAYRKYLNGITNNFDFAEMLNEFLGELNISHTGAVYTPQQKDSSVAGTLGIFYNHEYQGPGMQIEELLPGSPLDLINQGIKKDDILLSINGDTIEADKEIDYYLSGTTGKEIKLEIKSGQSVRSIKCTVISAEQEAELLYKRWVERNRSETELATNGEWGYIHLYRMNDAAFRNVYEEVLGRYQHCKGIIVDTRFNRGGDLAPELISFLSGSKSRINGTDKIVTGIEPSFRWTKPSIVLAGEANYSDGHCFVYDYQYLHMGKLIGMPVPGSCTWNTGQSLIDPSLSYSVPTIGVKTNSGVYLENYQTEPDIRSMNEYGIVGKGRDQQLEEAIRQSKSTPDAR